MSSAQRYPIIQFYLLIFALSIPFWLINPIADHLLDGIEINLPVSSLMAVCPLIAAFILVGRDNGRRGIRRLMATVLDPRRINRKINYVPIIILMPVIMLLSYIVMRMMELPLPKLDIQWLTIPVLFLVFFIAAVCEETGWIGYAANPMIEKWGVSVTGLVIGVVWAVWHVVPNMQADNTLYWIVGQFLFTVAIRVIMVIIYQRTGGSVLGCVLLHMMANVSWVVFPNHGSHYDPVITGTITAIVAIMLTIFIREGGSYDRSSKTLK